MNRVWPTQQPHVRIMPMSPSFSISFSIISTISCPKHDIILHNYALTITTTTRGTCLWSMSESLFYFALFTLLTSLLVKFSHSHPLYSLYNLCYFATFIHSAQRHHAHPLLTFIFPLMNSRISPQKRSKLLY